MSTNGYIARKNDETPWSSADFARFEEFIAEKGNVIIGRRTCKIMTADGNFNNLVQTIVLSRTEHTNEGNVTYVTSPQEALKAVAEKGYDTAVVAGGAQVDALFLQEKLVDELILNIEPLLLGSGLPLFTDLPVDIKLELVNVSQPDKHSVSLHYKILRD